MSGPNQLDRAIAEDLRKLAEAIRRQQVYLTTDSLHAAADGDLSQAVKLLERAADTLLSAE
jgi:hypothetical protein